MGEIKTIPSELAFNKGVDWFTEIVFFYGFLFGVSVYEMRKSIASSKRTQDRLNTCVEKTERGKNKVDAY